MGEWKRNGDSTETQHEEVSKEEVSDDVMDKEDEAKYIYDRETNYFWDIKFRIKIHVYAAIIKIQNVMKLQVYVAAIQIQNMMKWMHSEQQIIFILPMENKPKVKMKEKEKIQMIQVQERPSFLMEEKYKPKIKMKGPICFSNALFCRCFQGTWKLLKFGSMVQGHIGDKKSSGDRKLCKNMLQWQTVSATGSLTGNLMSCFMFFFNFKCL